MKRPRNTHKRERGYETKRGYTVSNPIVPPMRRCPKCGQSFPATKEYFFSDKQRIDCLSTYCKPCKTAASKVYKENNQEKIKAYFRQYHLDHAEHKRQRASEWQRNNPERARIRKRKHYEEHRERYYVKAQAWQKAHPERAKQTRRKINQDWYIRNRDRELKRMKTYRRKNPEVFKAIHHRRRLRAQSDNPITAECIRTQYKRQKGKCYYCQAKVGKHYHVDHIIPLSRGGTNIPDNIVIACPKCNLQKHDKLPHEWPEGGRLL